MSALGAVVPRRNQWHRVFVAIGIFAGIIAVLPIVGALIAAVIGSDSGARTAFASAPPGNYAVYSTAGDTTDQIRVASSTHPETTVFIAEVSHLPGFFARGAVSPDGRQLALVVADGGTQAAPEASLLVVDLETGKRTRAATGIDYLQTPLWEPDSDGVLVVDTVEEGISLLRSDAGGGTAAHIRTYDATGFYPVGFNGDGALVSILLDGRGSTAVVDGEEVALLSPSITRDWELSPDGTRIAFIETDMSSGVNYLPRIVSLASARVSAMAATADGQGLGVAWSPATGEPSFGLEPGGSGGVSAQSTGFDVPLAYSGDGSALAVTHWTGASFASPGDARFELLTPSGRTELAGATRFFGWSAR
ncbi:MAG: LpqB family beta-propeller domain-containing protein [Dehalococcoidia bacterium]